MNKNLKWLTVALTALLSGAIVSAAIQPYIFTNHGTIQAVGDFDYYIEGTLNPTSYDWGITEPNTIWLANLTIVSKYNTAITVSVTAILPTGWTHAWSLNNTVWAAYKTKWVDYELTIPATAIAGDYTWTTTITATEA